MCMEWDHVRAYGDERVAQQFWAWAHGACPRIWRRMVSFWFCSDVPVLVPSCMDTTAVAAVHIVRSQAGPQSEKKSFLSYHVVMAWYSMSQGRG